MKNAVVYILMVMVLLCGCSSQFEPAPALKDTVAATESMECTLAVSCTETEPKISVPETLPNQEEPFGRFLSAESGEYLENYYDEASEFDMDYYLFIPENAVEEMPLIIFLHGDDQIGRIKDLNQNPFITKTYELFGNEYPYISISPCTRMKSWLYDPIPDTLMNLISHVVQTYHIDQERIIITGHSRGAVGVWHMVNTYGDYFSAAVPISCHSWSELNTEQFVNVPVRAFCGDDEEIERHYNYMMSKDIKRLSEAGCDATLTQIKKCRHADAPAESYTEELIKWMLSQ